MPGVLKRYIKFENAGDQFVGRCVSGRSRKKKEFGLSSAYLDFTGIDDGEDKRRELNEWWMKGQLPPLAQHNEKVHAFFKLCIATPLSTTKNTSSKTSTQAVSFVLRRYGATTYHTLCMSRSRTRGMQPPTLPRSLATPQISC